MQKIKTYLATNEYADKAGAYGIQGQGALLIKEIAGDYYAIMGLPIARLRRMLTQRRRRRAWFSLKILTTIKKACSYVQTSEHEGVTSAESRLI